MSSEYNPHCETDVDKVFDEGLMPTRVFNNSMMMARYYAKAFAVSESTSKDASIEPSADDELFQVSDEIALKRLRGSRLVKRALGHPLDPSIYAPSAGAFPATPFEHGLSTRYFSASAGELKPA